MSDLGYNHTQRIINCIAFGSSYWGVSQTPDDLINPETGLKTSKVEGLYQVTYISTLFDSVKKCHHQPVKFPDTNRFRAYWLHLYRTGDTRAPSSYTSQGCLIYNLLTVRVKSWAYSRTSKKEKAGEMQLLLQKNCTDEKYKMDLDEMYRNNKLVTINERDCLEESKDRLSSATIDGILETVVCNLVKMPVLVALVYCWIFPKRDETCQKICKDIEKYFPEEREMFSKYIKTSIRNYKENKDSEIFKDFNNDWFELPDSYIEEVALAMIEPHIYVNLHCIKAQAFRFKMGLFTIDKFEDLLANADYTENSSPTNACIYITSETKFMDNISDWTRYTTRIGYIAGRYGFDIATLIINEDVSYLTLNSNGDIVMCYRTGADEEKRRELVARYEKVYSVYDEDGVFVDTKDSELKTALLEENRFQYKTLFKTISKTLIVFSMMEGARFGWRVGYAIGSFIALF